MRIEYFKNQIFVGAEGVLTVQRRQNKTKQNKLNSKIVNTTSRGYRCNAKNKTLNNQLNEKQTSKREKQTLSSICQLFPQGPKTYRINQIL